MPGRPRSNPYPASLLVCCTILMFILRYYSTVLPYMQCIGLCIVFINNTVSIRSLLISTQIQTIFSSFKCVNRKHSELVSEAFHHNCLRSLLEIISKDRVTCYYSDTHETSVGSCTVPCSCTVEKRRLRKYLTCTKTGE